MKVEAHFRERLKALPSAVCGTYMALPTGCWFGISFTVEHFCSGCSSDLLENQRLYHNYCTERRSPLRRILVWRASCLLIGATTLGDRRSLTPLRHPDD